MQKTITFNDEGIDAQIVLNVFIQLAEILSERHKDMTVRGYYKLLEDGLKASSNLRLLSQSLSSFIPNLKIMYEETCGLAEKLGLPVK